MKRVGKKVFLMALSAALAAAFLSGCKTGLPEKEDGGEKKTVTDYPKMAITINTSKSGSSVDYSCRAFAKILGEYLGSNVIVNSTSGQVEAVRETINAETDGYTLGFVNNTVVINDVAGTTDFDAVEDVEIVGTMAQSISSWIALRTDRAEELGIQSLEDLFAYSQAHPDELTVSDSPNSSTNACIRLLRDAGLLTESVSTGTGTDRLTALLSGACDIYIGNFGYLEQYIQTGEVICLASCSEERSGFSPDIPCTYELGYEVTFPVCYYICAPKGLPEDIVKVLNEAMAKVAEDENYVTDLKGNSNEPLYMDHDAAKTFLSNQKKALIEMGMGQE